MLLRAIHEYKNRIINSNLLHFEQKSTNINTKQASVTEKKKRKISGCPMYPSSYCMQRTSTLTLHMQNKNITPLNLRRFGGKII